ncbi:hotdog domain-containing protein [Thermomonospora catenispora]|uniref:hotdog domain-containing protein n=1 Tax=Thermomonospora catenispora TaxID=2493090 RepID=UPI001F4F19F6|nr:hotdog domain-containing protein [Thermomonospora catenispora]
MEMPHGGAVVALIDRTAGTAAADAGGPNTAARPPATVDLHVRHPARAEGDRVHASAEVLKVGRRLITVERRVTDEEAGRWPSRTSA